MNCPKCDGPMWDNRKDKRNPKAPDYKCKDRENCDGAVWLKSKKENEESANNGNGPAQAPAQAPAKNGSTATKDDYWTRKEQREIAREPRIEVQHSQDMAIEYAKMTLQVTGKMPSLANIDELTAHFWKGLDRLTKKSDIGEPSKTDPEPATTNDGLDL